MKQKYFVSLLGLLAIVAAGVPSAMAADPGSQELQITTELKYWRSTGKTTWNHNASASSPLFGNPTSQLTYSGMKSNVAEVGIRADKERFFSRINFGAGNIDSGNLRDEDWLVGQLKLSDTDSSLRNGHLSYWLWDFGGAVFKDQNIAFSLFGGYGQYKEKIDAYGLRNLPGYPYPNLPDSTKVITNDALWKIWRLGTAVDGKLSDQFKLNGELAYAFNAKLSNEDSHHLRTDLGPTPNIRHSGSGDGWMWQIGGAYEYTKALSFSAAYRSWLFRTKGTIRFANGAGLPINNFETTRDGLLIGMSYRF
ncbi:MAG: hypothetical protein K2Y16_10855 [Burkholderiales bacterium]|nr:hypothetical protein [Burkholderiales bacterium]